MFPILSTWVWTITMIVNFWTPMQSDIRATLDRGKDLYYEAKFQEAIIELVNAERKIAADTPKKDAVEVKLFLGVSYFVNGNLAAAKLRFGDIYRIEPDFESPVFKNDILALLADARTAYLDEVKAVCTSTCSSLGMAINNREVEQISTAFKALNDQCDCADVRSNAAQMVFDIARQELTTRQYERAQAHFRMAAQMDPALQSKAPGFGSIVVTVAGAGGRLWIDEQPAGEVRANVPSAAILLPAADHIVMLVPISPEYKDAVTTVPVVDGQTKPVLITAQPAAVTKSISLAAQQLFDLEAGRVADGKSADLMWYAGNLVPINNATLALLPGSPVFESITADALKIVATRNEPLTGLGAGRMIAVRTAEGAYAKMNIVSVGNSLSIRWAVFQ